MEASWLLGGSFDHWTICCFDYLWENNSLRCCATVFELPDTHGPSRPCAILKLLEFLLLPPQHLSLIHLNLFLNMLRDMGPILHSSRWITSCASTIYQIPLNSIFFCFVLSFAIYYDLFLKCYSMTLSFFLVFVPIPYRYGTVLQTVADRIHKATSATLFTFYICFGSNFRLPFLQMNFKLLTWIEIIPAHWSTIQWFSLLCIHFGRTAFCRLPFSHPQITVFLVTQILCVIQQYFMKAPCHPHPHKIYIFQANSLCLSQNCHTANEWPSWDTAHVIRISNLYF